MATIASFGNRYTSSSGSHRTQGAKISASSDSHVLIIDDQSTGRRILQELVSSLGPHISVHAYDDPLAALESVHEQVPDLVITDYKMPLMNGIEFTKRFRGYPACREVPLMVITVVGDRQIRYEALEAGATDFITRPIDYHECRARCRNLLTLRAQQTTIRERANWLESQVFKATNDIRDRERETLLRLAKAGEYRDEVTGNHILRIAKFSWVVAESIGLSDEECDAIEVAAPMHDIGKIGIPDRILLKPARLTDHEMEIMKQHTLIGYEILKESPSRYLQLGAEIALSHHEKYDGSGYPNGLAGEQIPIAARIVAVADVYDALTTVRPYKSAWSNEDAIDFIREQSGRHFDPLCTNHFLKHLDQIRLIQSELSDQASFC